MTPSHLDGKTGGSGREFPFTSNPFNPLTISDLGKAWQICCWARQISNSMQSLQSQGGVMWPHCLRFVECVPPLHRGLSKKCGFTPFFFQLFLSGKLVLNHGVDCVSLFIRRARKARNKEVVLGHQQSLSGRIRVLPPHPLRRSLPTTCRRIGSPCQCMISYELRQ